MAVACVSSLDMLDSNFNWTRVPLHIDEYTFVYYSLQGLIYLFSQINHKQPDCHVVREHSHSAINVDLKEMFVMSVRV